MPPHLACSAGERETFSAVPRTASAWLKRGRYVPIVDLGDLVAMVVLVGLVAGPQPHPPASPDPSLQGAERTSNQQTQASLIIT
jgi:hypothetical protein